MPTYEIAYHSHEDSGRVSLEHDVVFDAAALEAMVVKVTPDAARAHLEEERAHHDELANHFADKGGIEPFVPQVRFEALYDKVADLLCASYGFRHVKAVARVSVMGWADLLVRGDWDGDPLFGKDPLRARLTEALADAGLPVLSREEKEAAEAVQSEADAACRAARRAARGAKEGAVPVPVISEAVTTGSGPPVAEMAASLPVYVVDWEACDCGARFELEHPEVMDAATLEALVLDVLPQAVEAYLAKQRKDIAAEDALLVAEGRMDAVWPGGAAGACFTSVCKFIVGLLCERHGFRKAVRPAAEFMVAIPQIGLELLVYPEDADSLHGRMVAAVAKAGLPVLTIEAAKAHDKALAPVRTARMDARSARRGRQ